MKVGRNDPCPCGSGKKYKRCCLALDRDAGATAADAAGQVRRIAVGADEWQTDVVPVHVAFDDDPTARPALLLVTADGFVVNTGVLARPSPEVDDLAATLEEAVREAGERVGRLPPRLRVRDGDVARALAARFRGDGGPKVVAGRLDELDDSAASAAEHLTGQRPRLRASEPLTWAGWGLPDELVARLFRAAAVFHRAAPWKSLADDQPFTLTLDGGHPWLACVLGQGGKEFGLNLYADPDDYHRLFATGGVLDRYDPRSAVLLLSFEPGKRVDRQMRREVLKAGWELAGADAYPKLLALNTPAGGVRRAVAEELAAFLEAVPAFVAAHPEAVAASAPVAGWRHAETGVTVDFHPDDAFTAILYPGDAGGPNADPTAAFAGVAAVGADPEGFIAAELEVVDRFARHLAEAEGFAESTVAGHRDNAHLFVEQLASTGVPLPAVHLVDLLDFLYDWYPRKVFDSATGRKALPVSLTRFFAYLAEAEGIVCPWAEAVLADRDGLAERWEEAPTGFWWDPDVVLWQIEHGHEMQALLLVADSGLGDTDQWGSLMAQDEHRLHHELHRRWLLWRDELLREGVTGREKLVDQLVARQREWERSPHPDFAGDSPMTVVWRERLEREKAEARAKKERRAKKGRGKGKGAKKGERSGG